MKRILPCVALLACVAPAFAQTVTIGATQAGAPTREQGIECTAYYYTKALSMTRSTKAMPAEHRITMMAWINYMTTSTGQNQAQLMPEINAQKDILTTRLFDPGNPDVDKPYIDRCIAFETHMAAPG